jgi:transposase
LNVVRRTETQLTLIERSDAPELREVRLRSVALEPDLQPREKIDGDLVATYVELLLTGTDLPPVVAFAEADGLKFYLADGWHRYYAHRQIKRETIAAVVHPGGFDAALHHSLSANATHGKPRDPLTYKRAYDIAVRRGLVEPYDLKGVKELLGCRPSIAADLTREAREIHDEAQRSIALMLLARGLTQEQVAQRLGVPRRTISDWLGDSTENGETAKEATNAGPVIPQVELDRIAQEIAAEAEAKAEAKLKAQQDKRLKEIRGELEEEFKRRREELEVRHKEEIDRLRRDVEERLVAQRREDELALAELEAKLGEARRTLDEAQTDPQRAKADAERLRLEQELSEAKRALESGSADLEKERAALEQRRQEIEEEARRRAAEEAKAKEAEAKAKEAEAKAAAAKPSPAEARRLAEATCSFVLASDGHLYGPKARDESVEFLRRVTPLLYAKIDWNFGRMAAATPEAAAESELEQLIKIHALVGRYVAALEDRFGPIGG